ncbi:hypothetical protein pdam_00013634 [Pocillopora damicornis]|uniref:Uncharacterized protein n=1 Tax=Pocillopora damicornis TaxID=46731 RepID=A0A3M6ULH0_POCDA|nr:hypothetical protein pdam_00013634 [Pocillopora damicornis]
MLVVERSLVFLYTAIHTMMLPPRDIIFSAIIKPDSTMVKATLRNVDETNACPKLVSNGLVSNETSWAAGGAFDTPVMLHMTNFLPSVPHSQTLAQIFYTIHKER